MNPYPRCIAVLSANQKYSQYLPRSTGYRMHHTRTRTGTATSLSQGSVRHHAGMLAEGTAAEVKHQRHPENSLCLGQSHTRLPGHPGLVCVGIMFVRLRLSKRGTTWE